MQLLIIGDEDLFVEALGRFPSSTYSIAYAAGIAEAEVQAEACQPRIIIVAGLPDDEPLRVLLGRAHQRYGAVRIGVGVDEVQLAETFDHLIAEAERPKALDKIELLAYTLPTRAAGEAPDGTLEEQVARQARELKALEKRVAEIAVGTTGGLAELLVTMDGVQQALKLHMRLIEGLDQGEGEARAPGIAMTQVRQAQRALEERLSALSVQLAPFSTGGGEGEGRDARRITSQLEAQVEHQSHDLKSLEQRMSDVIVGTTGGLTELIEASDGTQQALKLHARLIAALEARIDNDVMPLRSSVVELSNEVKALRRDVRALQRSGPGNLDDDLESDLDLMLEPLEEQPPPARPGAATAGKPPVE